MGDVPEETEQSAVWQIEASTDKWHAYAECIEEDIMVAKTTENPQREELKQKFVDRLQLECSVSPDEASDKQIYQVLSALMVEKLKHKRQHFINKTNSVGGKNVYYLSMEFLMGRSLKTTLYNLELADDVRAILQDYHINLDSIFECEPDAGLGNGPLFLQGQLMRKF